MALIQSTAIPSGATDYELEQSLKLDRTRNTFLNKTFASAGNRRTFTLSFWLKMCDTSTTGYIIEGGDSDSDGNRFFLRLQSDGILRLSESAGLEFSSNALLRDPSAWYHIVIAINTTSSQLSNRIKLYINGEIQTFLSVNYPSQNHEYGINKAAVHTIGRSHIDDNNPINAYLSEFHFIDGTAKVASDFGETGTYGEWKPIEYSGTYGTNGFYLPFKQDYTVEGFSTVTYKGNGAEQYIGGTGFSPDLTWIKNRTSDDAHTLFDSVRGVTKHLASNTTGTEVTTAESLKAFNTDGFTLGTSNITNAGSSYVAWSWDMGGLHAPINVTVAGSAVHSTAESHVPSSSSSIYTPSGNGNYLQIGEAGDIDLGSNNFTFEFWIKNGSGYPMSGFGPSSSGTTGHSFYVSPSEGAGGNVYIKTSGGTNSFTVAPTWTNWNHIAIVRVGNVFTVYLNGTATGGTATLTGSVADNAFRLGRNGTDGADGSGYFEEVRISNTARYTTTFTPSTTPFVEDTNTLFLLQSDNPNNDTTMADSVQFNTDGNIDSRVRANPTYGQSIVSWTGTGATGTVGTGLTSDAEVVIVKGRTTTDNWSYSDTIQGSGTVRGGYLNGTARIDDTDWSSRVDPSSATANTIGVYNWDDGNKASTPMIAYCFHSVTGYSKLSIYSGTGGTHTVTTGFSPAFIMIKQSDANGENWKMYDNARYPNTDERTLDANTNGVEGGNSAVKINYLATGFQVVGTNADINANNTTYVYMAFADKREYAYWLDQSGNNNDWTSVNLTESDISVDTPSNNFCTLNPLDKKESPTFSEGNLKISVADDYESRGTIYVDSGKWYCEMYVASIGNNGTLLGISVNNMGEINALSSNNGVAYFSSNGNKYVQASGASYGASYAAGDIIGVALDQDNHTVNFYKNNVAQGALTIPTDSHAFSVANSGTASVVVTNFGQDSSFAGNKTAQGNQDGNDIGDFYYTPPTGYLALCTSNLSAPAVTPSENFNTVLYTGNGGTQSITGVGFQAGLTWIKARSEVRAHYHFDEVRGVEKALSFDATGAEDESSSYLSAFGSDGFSIGNTSTINKNNITYASWNWKVGGSSGSSNTNGSINTTSTSVNSDAGFSISTYTGNATSGATIGHGLSKAPEVIIVSVRSQAGGHNMYHTAWGSAAKTAPIQSYEPSYTNTNIWNSTAPGSSVFTIGNNSVVNTDNATFVAYCWHSVEGYSKFGVYKGTGNNDGPFIYCGFRPAFIMLKNSDAYQHYTIYDVKRRTFNPVNTAVYADVTEAESNDSEHNIDILSNGFKIRNNGAQNNTNSNDYMFMAFAETPFKYSNAR